MRNYIAGHGFFATIGCTLERTPPRYWEENIGWWLIHGECFKNAHKIRQGLRSSINYFHDYESCIITSVLSNTGNRRRRLVDKIHKSTSVYLLKSNAHARRSDYSNIRYMENSLREAYDNQLPSRD